MEAVVVCAVGALQACTAIPGHRQPLALRHPVHHPITHANVPPAANHMNEPPPCETSDPATWSDARKTDLFRRFDEWEAGGQAPAVEPAPPENRLTTLTGCRMSAE